MIPDPIRVAFVVHTFGVGGLERCVAHLVNELDPARFEPMIVCFTRNGDAAQWIRRSEVPIVELYKPPRNSLRTVLRLVRALLDYRPDLIHTHNWATLIESTLARRWVSGIRHVHAEHGLVLGKAGVPGLKIRARQVAMRWALNRVDTVVACAESVKERVSRECGFPRSRMLVVPNGVESPATDGRPSRAAELRSRLGLKRNSFVYGSVGNLRPVKDFGTAINALRIATTEGHDVHFVVVGNGTHRQQLEAHAVAAGVADRVHLVGPQQNVGDWLRVFDVYINSSVSEGMSMSILEAMATGLPVVATDVGDAAALIGGDPPAGLLVPPADPPSLARAVSELIGNLSRRKELGENARRRYNARYTVRHMVDRYSTLYSQVAAQGRSRTASRK